MKILIACEYSGITRRAFEKKNHDVWSCDKRESELFKDKHIVGDVREILDQDWDMVIAYPPLMDGSLIQDIAAAPVEKIAIENIARCLRQVNTGRVQMLSPGTFAQHIKASALWLKNLPDISPHESAIGIVWKKPAYDKHDDKTDNLLAKRMAELWG
ncbi:hypothetical protein KW791_00230 [Candidatus Parcubacteria bacterium]|nr:hypothetical protein [Candidatus Parcubacteria bacterium]